jgi:hypothetical protein
MAPRLIEFCFQTAGIWQIARDGSLALPMSLGGVTTYRQLGDAAGRLYAVVTAVEDGRSFDARVLDEAGNLYVEMRGYQTVNVGRMA